MKTIDIVEIGLHIAMVVCSAMVLINLNKYEQVIGNSFLDSVKNSPDWMLDKLLKTLDHKKHHKSIKIIQNELDRRRSILSK